jgi:hypothetical protein
MAAPTQVELDFICLIAANIEFERDYCKLLPSNATGEMVWAWRELQMAISWAYYISRKMIDYDPLLVVPIVTYTNNLTNIEASNLDNIAYLVADIDLALSDCEALQITLAGWASSGLFFPLIERLRQAKWWLDLIVQIFKNP